MDAYSPEWVETQYKAQAEKEAARIHQMFQGRGANFGAEKDILARRLGEIRDRLELDAANQNAAITQRATDRTADVEERKRQESVAQAREERARQDQQEYYRQIRESQFLQSTPYGRNGENGVYDLKTGTYARNPGFQNPYGQVPAQPKTDQPTTEDPNAPRVFYDLNKKKRFLRDPNTGQLIEDTFGVAANNPWDSPVAAPGGGSSTMLKSSTPTWYPSTISPYASDGGGAEVYGGGGDYLEFDPITQTMLPHNYLLKNRVNYGNKDPNRSDSGPLPYDPNAPHPITTGSDYGSDNSNNDLRNKNTNTQSPGGDLNPLNYGGGGTTRPPDRYDQPMVTGNGEVALPPLQPPQTNKDNGTTEDLYNEFFNRPPAQPKGPYDYGDTGTRTAALKYKSPYVMAA